jgi:hypothetical protein
MIRFALGHRVFLLVEGRSVKVIGGEVGVGAYKMIFVILNYYSLVVLNHHPESISTSIIFFARQFFSDPRTHFGCAKTFMKNRISG